MVYNKISKAILNTLVYRDIFDSPLSRQELWRFLISDTNINKSDFESSLLKLPKAINYKDGFYSLSGKEENIKKRKKNMGEVQKKLRLAEGAARLISFIPSVYLIGLSGGVAVGNVDKEDDIDLFIIVKRNTLLITRFWILVVLEAAGLRRKPHEKGRASADKICVNLLIDESALLWPRGKRDLYIAHEIGQVKPLFERNAMYSKFMDSNKWVSKFLPNVFSDEVSSIAVKSGNDYHTIKFFDVLIRFSFLPFIVGIIQKISMKKRQTTEVIKHNVLAFHPHDYRKETLAKMADRAY